MSMFGFGKKDDPFPPGPGKKKEGEGEGDDGEKKPGRPSNARIAIWVIVGAIALYLIGSGVIGILTH
jgi:hypothetical protein